MRPDTPFTGPDLCARPAREIVAGLRRGDLDPAAVLAASETRVRQVEPDINAMPTTCFDRAANEIAKLPQRAAKNGGHAAWLAGLPIGIKDLNNVAGVRTTYASKAFADFVPDTSHPMVELLESRGALVVGKTNTPEMGAGGNSTNAVFGSTRNPWDTRMNAGGSSGGAAASLAAGEVWLSHGSDLMGSLRTPAAHCGVLGFRTSPGRTGGGSGMTAFLPEALQGPMARDVRDMALFLDAMTGYDERLPLTIEAPATPFQNELDQLDRPPRIAFSVDQNGFALVEHEIRARLNDAMQAVARAGATVDNACPDLPTLNETYLALRGMHYGAAARFYSADVQAQFGQRLRDNIDFGMKQDLNDVYDAMINRTKIFDIMRVFLHNYDVLAIPVVGIEPIEVEQEFPAVVDGQQIGTYENWLRFSFLATTASLPAMSMPVGFTTKGLPVGLQLIGPPRGEARLLQVALFIEDALGLSAAPIDPIVRHR